MSFFVSGETKIEAVKHTLHEAAEKAGEIFEETYGKAGEMATGAIGKASETVGGVAERAGEMLEKTLDKATHQMGSAAEEALKMAKSKLPESLDFASLKDSFGWYTRSSYSFFLPFALDNPSRFWLLWKYPGSYFSTFDFADWLSLIGFSLFVGVRMFWEFRARSMQRTRGVAVKREMESYWQSMGTCAAMLAGLVLNVAFGPLFRLPFIVRSIGGFGLLVAAAGMHWAHANLGEMWTPNVAQLAPHRLVKTGPYQFVRHPMYSFGILGYWALILCTGSPMQLLNSAYSCAVAKKKIPQEEAILDDVFKKQFTEWKKNTWRIIPYLW